MTLSSQLTKSGPIKLADDDILSKIRYNPPNYNTPNTRTESVTFYGIDTEAYTDGVCAMIGTSEGDAWTPDQWPACLFTRKYRGVNFVCWNLKYDSGALLQWMSREALQELRKEGEVEYEGYKIKTVGNKCLSFRWGKNTVHIYDLFTFFNTTLQKASETYLDDKKLETDVNEYTREYVRENWDHVAEYCIHDADLTKRLCVILLDTFRGFGINPRKLYSTAYVSWQYFRSKCPYVHVKRYWDDARPVLRMAMQSYNGGKFEVVEKGFGNYHEYDIVSAYPYEISNLMDVRKAKILYRDEYRPDATYGFVDVIAEIPPHLPSPVVVKKGQVCTFPAGVIRRVITKAEYEFLVRNGCDVKIVAGCWLFCREKLFPYREEILSLMEWKDRYKREGDKLRYHTTKIFLNSLYGKFVQLTPKKTVLEAGAAWNPIYASVITANTRIRISEMQRKHPSVIAVHTDSVISKEPLDYPAKGSLGDMVHEESGAGVILGSGIYQVGEKSKFRGFRTKTPLLDLLPSHGPTLTIERLRPWSWKEVLHLGLDLALINRFEEQSKGLRVNFDAKRVWLDDWQDFADVRERNVYSVPLPVFWNGEKYSSIQPDRLFT